MSILSKIFRSQPRDVMGKVAASLLDAGCSGQLPEWMASGIEQPREVAQAEWLALQVWILDYTIQKTLATYEKVQPLWRAIQRQCRSRIPPNVYPHFVNIMNERTKEYGDWFNFGFRKCESAEPLCKTATPLFTFYGFVATRIVKPPQTLEVGVSTFQ
jgi:hypothetical protein